MIGRRSKDHSGKVFGRWKVVDFSHVGTRKEAFWNCVCECGTKRAVKAGSLTSGKSLSCGCYHKERVTTHGDTGLPTFKSWESMKQRCTNPKAPDYPRYGGRGITICDEWINSYDTFVKDMGQRPKGRSLDRIDVNGNYEPSNCRWATNRQQQNNKKNSPRLKHNGSIKTVGDWSKESGIPAKVILWRIAHDWDAGKAIYTPVRKKVPRKKSGVNHA